MKAQEHFSFYHATDPFAVIRPHARRWYEQRARNYRHVAEVVAPLEQIFALTKHDEEQGAWTKRTPVVWSAPGVAHRSTSVGDVILAHQSGQAWLVMPTELIDIRREDQECESTRSVCNGIGENVTNR